MKVLMQCGRDICTALDPNRINEEPFVIPEDQEATKAIPVITDEQLQSTDETIVRKPEKQTIVYDHDKPEIQLPTKRMVKSKISLKTNRSEKKVRLFWSLLL